MVISLDIFRPVLKKNPPAAPLISFSSEPHFLLVTHRENRDGIRVDAVASHIAAVAEVDYSFPELVGQIFNGAADTRLMPKNFHPLPHGLMARLPASIFLVARKR